MKLKLSLSLALITSLAAAALAHASPGLPDEDPRVGNMKELFESGKAVTAAQAPKNMSCNAIVIAPGDFSTVTMSMKFSLQVGKAITYIGTVTGASNSRGDVKIGNSEPLELIETKGELIAKPSPETAIRMRAVAGSSDQFVMEISGMDVPGAMIGDEGHQIKFSDLPASTAGKDFHVLGYFGCQGQ